MQLNIQHWCSRFRHKKEKFTSFCLCKPLFTYIVRLKTRIKNLLENIFLHIFIVTSMSSQSLQVNLLERKWNSQSAEKYNSRQNLPTTSILKLYSILWFQVYLIRLWLTSIKVLKLASCKYKNYYSIQWKKSRKPSIFFSIYVLLFRGKIRITI